MGFEPVWRKNLRRKAAMGDLLRSLFSEIEFRRAVKMHPDGDEILSDILSSASYNELILNVIESFERRGIDQEFFEILAELRPRRLSEVRRVAELWDVVLKPP